MKRTSDEISWFIKIFRTELDPLFNELRDRLDRVERKQAEMGTEPPKHFPKETFENLWPERAYDEALLVKAHERIEELENCLWEFVKIRPKYGTPVLLSIPLFERAEKLLGVVHTTSLGG